MQFDPTQVLANARNADTHDLLDRVTAYRSALEPEALELFELELHRRGVTPAQIEEHARQYVHCVRGPDGTAQKCSWCPRPALTIEWGWHRLWGLVPVLPRLYRCCSKHQSS